MEMLLLTDGEGLVVASELFHHKGSFLNSNQWSECVPEVLIAKEMRGEPWKWTGTTKSGV